MDFMDRLSYNSFMKTLETRLQTFCSKRYIYIKYN